MSRLIDADALHNSLRNKQKWVVRSSYGEKYNEGYTYDQVHFAIDDAPTVDAVERKRGEWVDDGLDSIGFMGIEYRLQKCSKCGETIAKAPMQRLPNFCSNCGADMRGESND